MRLRRSRRAAGTALPAADVPAERGASCASRASPSGALLAPGRRALLLVNPSAGRGRAARLGPAAERALRRPGVDVSVVVTHSLDEAQERAGAAPAGSLVAALGGDGFLGAAAAGAHRSGAVLMPLAGGRGNDTVRRLGLPLNPVRAIGQAPHYGVIDIDLGMVDGRVFLGVAHVGLDALANEYGNAARVGLGPFIYLYGGLKALRAWRDVTFTLDVDGDARSFPGWAVAVGNTGQYGGGLRICPDATVDDGVLDVVALGECSVPRVVATFLRAYRGAHLGGSAVHSVRARRVALAADTPLNVYADGELVGPLPAVVTLLPKALKVLMPVGSAALG